MPSRNIYFPDKLYLELLKKCDSDDTKVHKFILEAVEEKLKRES